MTDRRILRIASKGARVLAGAIASAAVVVAVVVSIAIPWPTRTQEPVEVKAIPAPATVVSICGGPLLALGRNAQDVASLSVATGQNLLVAVPQGDPAPEQSPLEVPGTPGAGAVVLTAPPAHGRSAVIAGGGSSTVKSDDLVGFAASACEDPRSESWLVGGATTTGTSDLVRLANPGTVPATVQLTVYGARGAQVPPGGRDLVIPPGTERIVPLAGLILGEQSPVVYVSAAGAPVRASLQASITRTIVPGGVEQVSAIQTSDRVQVIPGVVVEAAVEGTTDANPATILRILAPTASADATVTVIGTTGNPESTLKVPLKAGVPAEVELGGLLPGRHTVRVEADSPIVSAVWSTTGFGPDADFAWFPAPPDIVASTIFAVPEGPAPILSVANPGTASASVTLTPTDGGSGLSLTIGAGQTAQLPVNPGTSYILDPRSGTRILATVSYSGPGALAAFPVWPEDAAALGITVYPG